MITSLVPFLVNTKTRAMYTLHWMYEQKFTCKSSVWSFFIFTLPLIWFEALSDLWHHNPSLIMSLSCIQWSVSFEQKGTNFTYWSFACEDVAHLSVGTQQQQLTRTACRTEHLQALSTIKGCCTLIKNRHLSNELCNILSTQRWHQER